MAILFALLALVSSALATLFFGIIGLCVTALLAFLAVVFAVKKRKQDGSGGGVSIVLSILAIIVAAFVTIMLFKVSSIMVNESDKAETPLIKTYGNDIKIGIIPMMNHANKDGVDMDEMSKQFEIFTDYLKTREK